MMGVIKIQTACRFYFNKFTQICQLNQLNCAVGKRKAELSGPPQAELMLSIAGISKLKRQS